MTVRIFYLHFFYFVVVIQLLTHVRVFVTPWTAAHQASLSFTISCSLLKLMSIETVRPCNHLILCYPILLLSSIFPSIRVYSDVWCFKIRCPKYWSCSFSISPCNEYSWLIYFRIDWFDLLAVQGTLKSRLQHHSSKALIFWCSAFFMVQLSHPYMTTGKTIALTTWTFIGKVMSLLFITLSRFVIVFLPRRKCLLISWLQSPSAVKAKRKLRAQESKICHCFYCFPIYWPWIDATWCRDLSFLMLSLKPTFYSPLSCSSRGSLVPLSFLPLGWCHLHIWGYWYFSDISPSNLIYSLIPAGFIIQPSISHDVLCM